MDHGCTTGVRQRGAMVAGAASTRWKQTAFPMAWMMIIPAFMKHLALIVALVGSLFAAAAVATPRKQLALPVGHSMTMAMPSQVTSVHVADPSLVEVRRQGRKVTLVALSKGSTDATVMTAEGSTTFRVYVAADKYALPQ